MIEIEYIVKDRQGVERLRTADKKEADAYDRVLDVADRLVQLLRDDQVVPNLADEDLDELAIYLARNGRTVERILKGKDVGAAGRGKSESDPQPRPHSSETGQDTESEPQARPLRAVG